MTSSPPRQTTNARERKELAVSRVRAVTPQRSEVRTKGGHAGLALSRPSTSPSPVPSGFGGTGTDAPQQNGRADVSPPGVSQETAPGTGDVEGTIPTREGTATPCHCHLLGTIHSHSVTHGPPHQSPTAHVPFQKTPRLSRSTGSPDGDPTAQWTQELPSPGTGGKGGGCARNGNAPKRLRGPPTRCHRVRRQRKALTVTR